MHVVRMDLLQIIPILRFQLLSDSLLSGCDAALDHLVREVEAAGDLGHAFLGTFIYF
jgi:hypothetical protein